MPTSGPARILEGKGVSCKPCPINNLNFRIKTKPVSFGAGALGQLPYAYVCFSVPDMQHVNKCLTYAGTSAPAGAGSALACPKIQIIFGTVWGLLMSNIMPNNVSENILLRIQKSLAWGLDIGMKFAH